MTNKRKLYKMDVRALAEFLLTTDFCNVFCGEFREQCTGPGEECIRHSIDWLCDEAEEDYKTVNHNA